MIKEFAILCSRSAEIWQPEESDFNTYSIHKWEYYHEKTREALLLNKLPLKVVDLWKMRRPLAIAAHTGEIAPECYSLFRSILETIRSQDVVEGFENAEAWLSALKITRSYRNVTKHDPYALNAFEREGIVARSLMALRAQGLKYEIEDQGVRIEPDSLSVICQRLDSIIRVFGGQNVISYIFKIFEINQNIYRGYFLSPRITAGIPQHREASVPWNFIYNLALKYLSTNSSSENPAATWNGLVSLARHIGAVIDVEPYIIWENVHVSYSNLNEVLLDNLHFDELFVIPQWGGDKAQVLFGWWCDALVEVGCQMPVVSAEVWKEIGAGLLSRAHSYKTSILRKSDRISCNISKEIFRKVIDLISIEPEVINSEFITPFDISKKTAGDFPLWSIGRGLHIIPPKGIAARALYQNIYALMRNADIDGKLEHRLGLALERLSIRVFKEHGESISIQSGKYNHTRFHKRFEVDIAIETEPRIILVECKKKSLTNAARTGNIPAALIDLSNSVIYTLEQMARHEIHLRDKGILECLNGETIILGSKKIERISIGFLDHGALQGRGFIESIVKTLMFSTVGSSDPEIMKELKKVNARALNLRDYLTSLSDDAKEEIGAFLHSWFFGNWWLSVDQLAAILDEGKPIWDALMQVRHVMFGTGSVLAEFSSRARMEARATAESVKPI